MLEIGKLRKTNTLINLKPLCPGKLPGTKGAPFRGSTLVGQKTAHLKTLQALLPLGFPPAGSPAPSPLIPTGSHQPPALFKGNHSYSSGSLPIPY